jgi:hypothetical protein
MAYSNGYPSTYSNGHSSIGIDWLANRQQEVAQLRHLLKQCNAWPAAGDDFLQLIAKSHWNATELKQEDNQYLPQVVEATLSGQDIGAQYPSFFQKLLSYSTLRQSFIRELSKNL